MKRRNRRHGRGRSRRRERRQQRIDDLLTPKPKETFDPKGGTSFLMKPETRLMLGIGRLVCDYATEKLFSLMSPEELAKVQAMSQDEARDHLKKLAKDLKAQAQHPEGAEPIKTKIDERQEGRSEVIREIADPKES